MHSTCIHTGVHFVVLLMYSMLEMNQTSMKLPMNKQKLTFQREKRPPMASKVATECRGVHCGMRLWRITAIRMYFVHRSSNLLWYRMISDGLWSTGTSIKLLASVRTTFFFFFVLGLSYFASTRTCRLTVLTVSTNHRELLFEMKVTIHRYLCADYWRMVGNNWGVCYRNLGSQQAGSLRNSPSSVSL